MTLPRFTLSHDGKSKEWKLKNSKGQTVRVFDTKADALVGGVLRRSVGAEGGSVRVQKLDGDFQEERTFPRSADPKRSPG